MISVAEQEALDLPWIISEQGRLVDFCPVNGANILGIKALKDSNAESPPADYGYVGQRTQAHHIYTFVASDMMGITPRHGDKIKATDSHFTDFGSEYEVHHVEPTDNVLWIISAR